MIRTTLVLRTYPIVRTIATVRTICIERTIAIVRTICIERTIVMVRKIFLNEKFRIFFHDTYHSCVTYQSYSTNKC